MEKLIRVVPAVLFVLFLGACSRLAPEYDVPYVATPMEVVDRMLELAQVKTGDVLYDLGSGDGRIVIRAAKKYGIRGVGVELDPKLVEISRIKAKEEGVEHLVEFQVQDALAVDVSPATVVTLYLLPEINNKLEPRLRKQLKPGSRVVSHDFGMEGWSPKKVEAVRGNPLHRHTIYVWEVAEVEFAGGMD